MVASVARLPFKSSSSSWPLTAILLGADALCLSLPTYKSIRIIDVSVRNLSAVSSEFSSCLLIYAQTMLQNSPEHTAGSILFKI